MNISHKNLSKDEREAFIKNYRKENYGLTTENPTINWEHSINNYTEAEQSILDNIFKWLKEDYYTFKGGESYKVEIKITLI